MSTNPADPRGRLRAAEKEFRKPSRRPAFFAVLFFLLCATAGGSLLARAGTPLPRLAGAILIGLPPLVLAIWSVWAARRWRKLDYVVRRAVGAADPELSDRLRRALSLVQRVPSGRVPSGKRAEPSQQNGDDAKGAPVLSSSSGESPELARMHLVRTARRISLGEVARAGKKRSRRLLVAALGLAILAVGLVVGSTPMKLVEGLDVLMARDGVAPVRLPYLVVLDVKARMPAYLRDGGKSVPLLGNEAALPRGSTLRYSILPRHADREYVLTDGEHIEKFVEDGKGGLVARFEVDDKAKLRVAARFGNVLVFDTSDYEVTPVDDAAPQVELEQAPRTLALEDFDRIDLAFRATDDHGLSAVDVVLRSGRREERIEVVKLDGQTRSYRGGQALTRQHPFLRGAFLSIAVTVEARDNDTVTGPKWGKSETITLRPPPLGKETAERHRRLRAFREELTTYLAADVRAARLTMAEAKAERKEQLQTLVNRFEGLSEELKKSESAPRGTLTFLKAQLEGLEPDAEDPVRPESVLLATDSLLNELAQHDARAVAGDIASLVGEIATRAADRHLLEEGREPAPVLPMIDAASRASKALADIGRLGHDLGNVAQADLERVKETAKQQQWQRAEAAALHLAERLQRGTPSFGSKGNPGVESGRSLGGGSGRGSQSSPSSAPSEYEKMARDADRIAQRHAEQLTELERLLRQARKAAALDTGQRDQMQNASQELRRAMEDLPSIGFNPGTARSEAAQARSQGEATADALESNDPAAAVERGEVAKQAIERAKKRLEQQGGMVSERALEEAEQALDDALSVAKQAQKQVQQQIGKAMRSELEERAKKEQGLSEQVDELLRQAQRGEARLPAENEAALRRAGELMKRAAQAMQAGDGQRSADLADEAQVELERAQPRSAQRSQRSSERGGKPGDGDRMAEEAKVPEDEEDRARAFRERVERGLGRPGGRLGPAVRRYAEELK